MAIQQLLQNIDLEQDNTVFICLESLKFITLQFTFHNIKNKFDNQVSVEGIVLLE